jgi:hypothetical protein
MGFFSSIKKMFGFGESTQQNDSLSSEVEVVDTYVPTVEEVKSEPIETPVVEELVYTKEQTIEEPTTVKEIKSKARNHKEQSNDSEPTKSKKPYRRRPKKDKPQA